MLQVLALNVWNWQVIGDHVASSSRILRIVWQGLITTCETKSNLSHAIPDHCREMANHSTLRLSCIPVVVADFTIPLVWGLSSIDNRPRVSPLPIEILSITTSIGSRGMSPSLVLEKQVSIILSSRVQNLTQGQVASVVMLGTMCVVSDEFLSPQRVDLCASERTAYSNWVVVGDGGKNEQDNCYEV